MEEMSSLAGKGWRQRGLKQKRPPGLQEELPEPGGPEGPHPNASCGEVAERFSGLPPGMTGSVSLSLPSLSWETSNLDGVSYHPQSPHTLWTGTAQSTTHRAGQGKEGSKRLQGWALWTGHHQSRGLGQNPPSLLASVSPPTQREMQSLVFPSFNPAFTLILQLGRLRHRKAECPTKFHNPQ